MKKERFYYTEDYFKADLEILLDPEANIVGTGKVRNVESLPKVTICGVWDTDDNTMTFGVARCAMKDKFDKSIGRELARKRVNENPFRVVAIAKDERIPDVFLNNCREIEMEVLNMSYPIVVS